MVFPIFLLLATAFLILSICLYVHYRGKLKNYVMSPDEKYSRGDLDSERGFWKGWIIATPLITLAFLAFGSLAVLGGSKEASDLSYADNVKEAKVERFIPMYTDTGPNYMFILDNGEAIAVEDYNLDILESTDGPGKVRYGYAYESWGHWLPFNDWTTDYYQVEYTPGK